MNAKNQEENILSEDRRDYVLRSKPEKVFQAVGPFTSCSSLTRLRLEDKGNLFHVLDRKEA